MNLTRKTITFLLFVGMGIFGLGCEKKAPDDHENASSPEEESGSVEPAEWVTDYEAALVRAGEQEKSILMNFTGSDWCPPCKLLKRDIFQTDDFARYAAENLILVEVDFPFGYQQEPELVQQNEALQEDYKIEDFPTLIMLNPDGEEERRTTGYMEGGPEAFINWLEG